LFLTINEFASELIKGERSGKYTPVEVAQWIEDYSDTAEKSLMQAEKVVKNKKSAEYRRISIDIAAVINLGRFFGAKFRAGVLYGIFEQSSDPKALEESLKYYRKARGFWADLVNLTKDVYKPDITIGENPVIRGHWSDRLPAIDEDIDFMTKISERTKETNSTQKENVRLAIMQANGRPVRPSGICKHIIPGGFKVGQDHPVEISFDKKPGSVFLHYRHVNHAERFESVLMKGTGNTFRAEIPASYTDTAYPLQYYFEVKNEAENAFLHPGFTADLTNQPYFVLHKI
jgi:hypothetical protein